MELLRTKGVKGDEGGHLSTASVLDVCQVLYDAISYNLPSTSVEKPMVPHIINELRSHYCRALAVEFQPGSNSKALLLRMRQACFRKMKVADLGRTGGDMEGQLQFPRCVDCCIRRHGTLILNTSCLLGSPVKI